MDCVGLDCWSTKQLSSVAAVSFGKATLLPPFGRPVLWLPRCTEAMRKSLGPASEHGNVLVRRFRPMRPCQILISDIRISNRAEPVMSKFSRTTISCTYTDAQCRKQDLRPVMLQVAHFQIGSHEPSK